MKLQSRIDQLRAQVKDQASAAQSRPELAEVQARLQSIDRLLQELSALPSSPQDDAGALGPAPSQVMRLLFHLDRCEDLLSGPGPDALRSSLQMGQLPPPHAPERLLYPSLRATAARRCIAAFLYFRGRWTGSRTDYDQPTVREILYLKSPAWLAPIMRLFLPRRRPRWAYEPPLPPNTPSTSDQAQK